MKRKFKLIPALIVLMMLAGINLAEAQTDYGIKIAGKWLTPANAGAINNANFPNLGLANGGSITYDHSSKTFTLTNVQASVTNYEGFIYITSSADAPANGYKINLVGSNNITVTGTWTWTNGIETYRNLTIEGGGSLKLTASGGSSTAFVVRHNVTLTIKNTTVEAIGGDSGIEGSYGTSGETLIIENSTVKVTGNGRGSIHYLQTITLTGCDITQPTGAAVATNGTDGKAVMLNGSVVKSQVVIVPVVQYGIQIAGRNLTSANAGAITNANFPNLGLTSGSITYNHFSKTFTLTNVQASVTNSESFIEITSSADAPAAGYKINLVGSSNIAVTWAHGIDTYRSLTIEGSGSLKVTVSEGNYSAFLVRKFLTIKNTTVEAIGNYNGIIGVNGTSGEALIIENSTVKAVGSSGGSIRDLQTIVLTGCDITQPTGAAVATTSTAGMAVMLNGSVVYSQVVIVPAVQYGIKIAGKDLTSANAGAITNANFPNLGLTSGSITYDHSSKTFTLTNVQASVTNSESFISITSTAATPATAYKINLVGNSNITATRTGTWVNGINTYQNLTIEGSGSLKLKASGSTSNAFLVASNQTLTIKNTTVEAQGVTGISGATGSNETLIIENSTVKATGGGAGSIVRFQNITLTGCDITQPTGAAVATDGTWGKAVMLNGSPVYS